MQVSHVGLEQDEMKSRAQNIPVNNRHQHLNQHYIQQPKASHGSTIHQRPKWEP